MTLGPTSVDRLLERIHQAAPKLTRASDLILLGAAGALALVDVVIWATDPVVDTGRLTWSIAIVVPCLGALATIAVAIRRRRRTLVLTIIAGFAIVLTLASWTIGTSLPPSFAALFALGLLIIGVVRHAPGRTAVVLTTLATFAVSAEALRPRVITAAYLLVVCQAAFGAAVGAGVYLRWSDWRRVAAAEAARSDERLEIAREMHDMVGHYVSGIVVRAQAARHVAVNQPAAAADALESIEVAGTDALLAMRRMVASLREDSPTAPGVTWDDVDQLVADAVAGGEPVSALIELGDRVTALTLVPSVYRIIAESLTNVRRHARQVSCIEVAVFRCADQLVVRVGNDGQLASADAHDDGFGIVGMRERAVSLGGSLAAGPRPNGGWLVHAELPMEHRR